MDEIGLDSAAYGTHSLRRNKPSLFADDHDGRSERYPGEAGGHFDVRRDPITWRSLATQQGAWPASLWG